MDLQSATTNLALERCDVSIRTCRERLAIGNDHVEFGLSRRPDTYPAAAGITWQLGVSDADAAIAACEQSRLSFEVDVERPREDWTYRVIRVKSPNGMTVLLEEQSPPA